MNLESLSGVILAGGKSQRMGGQDKGLLAFRNELMVLSVARALAVVTDFVFINANRHLEQYKDLNFEVITDLVTHSDKGPLSGLFSSLEYATTTHLLVAPCDTPCISPDAFAALKKAAQSSSDIIHYLKGKNGRNPLHAILPVSTALLSLNSFLSVEKRYSVMAFYEAFGCQEVLWENTEELLNVNTPESLL